MSASDRDKSSEGQWFFSRKYSQVSPVNSPVRAKNADGMVGENRQKCEVEEMKS